MTLARFACCLALLFAASVHAEPYLAVGQGAKCSQCHVNPSGGGLRNPFGDVFAQTQLPARHLDTGTDTWAGLINRFLSLGGDLRFDNPSRAATPVADTKCSVQRSNRA